jgi:hypothetical protein
MPNPYALNELRRLASRFTTDNPDDMGSNPGGSIDSDIALVSPPAPPPFQYRPQRPPLVSRGGDMAPSLDQGVPAFSGASVLMSAPPGERVSYDEPATPAVQAPRTNLYSGGGNLSGNSALNDTDVQRYLLNNQFADETEDRIVANKRAAAASLGMSNPALAQRTANAYMGESNALIDLLGNYQRSINEGPIPQGIAEAEQYRQAERAAQLQGFSGGQKEAAKAGREMETAKINAPIEAARVKAEGDLAAQQAQSQGLKDVADIQAKSLASQYAALQAALSGGNADAIKGVTLPKGGGSVSYQSLTQQRTPPIPANLLRDITTARTKLEQAGPTKNFMGLFPYGQTPEKIMYDQTIANALSAYEQTHPGTRDVADVASFVAGEPDLVGLTADQLMAHPKMMKNFDFSAMTPEEKDQLDQLLYVVRGMPGAAGQTDPSAYFLGQ